MVEIAVEEPHNLVDRACTATRFSAIDQRTEDERREEILELVVRMMVFLFLGVFMRYRADKVHAS